MLDIDAPIVPGEGLGGIPLGTAVADIQATAEPLRVIELPTGDATEEVVTIHSFGAIRTWSVQGRVEQVGAFEGYNGRTDRGIGIGSTVEAIQAAYGDVEPMGGEGVIRMPALPGIGIETTPWSTGAQPDPAASAVQLFVHGVD